MFDIKHINKLKKNVIKQMKESFKEIAKSFEEQVNGLEFHESIDIKKNKPIKGRQSKLGRPRKVN